MPWSERWTTSSAPLVCSKFWLFEMRQGKVFERKTSSSARLCCNKKVKGWCMTFRKLSFVSKSRRETHIVLAGLRMSMYHVQCIRMSLPYFVPPWTMKQYEPVNIEIRGLWAERSCSMLFDRFVVPFVVPGSSRFATYDLHKVWPWPQSFAMDNKKIQTASRWPMLA